MLINSLTFRHILFTLFWCVQLLSFNSVGQTLRLNEVMTNNKSYLEIDGSYYDWLELYNSSNTVSVQLSDYFVSDNENDLYKYQLPNLQLAPNAHFTLICSGENLIINGNYHTNFALNNLEKICLSTSQGVLNTWEVTQLPSDLSFGVIEESNNETSILQFPSFNTFNESTQNNKITASHSTSLYSDDFHFKLNSYNNDTIFYSLNNYHPTSNPLVFSDSLLIPINLTNVPDVSQIPSTSFLPLSYHNWQAPSQAVQKCFSISYASYRNGQRTSPIYHKTFIPETNNTNLDIVSITSDSVGLFSNQFGILVPGDSYLDSDHEWTGNFFREGENWERKAHLTYITQSQNRVFSQPLTIKIAGGKTRQSAQKSLALQASEELANSKLLLPVFQTAEAPFINALTLKTTMGDWETHTMIKDILAHKISQDLSFKSQDYKFVEVYINGVYFGVQSLRERFSPKNFLQNLEHDDLTILNPSNLTVNYGTTTEFEKIIDFVENNSMSNANNYEQLTQKIDIENLIDYYCAELFFGNYDWPINNIKVIKAGSNQWQWLFYDLDGAFLNAQTNMFEHLTHNDETTSYPNPPASTLLFRKLIENKTFESSFILRYTQLLHSTFSKQNTTAALDQLKDELIPLIPSQINRWGFPSSFERWEADLDILRQFLIKRPCLVINNMNSFFESEYLQTACHVKWNDTENFKIYPNPTSDFIHIISKDQQLKINRIGLYNSIGKLVQEKTPLKQSFHYSLSIQSLSQGSYTLILYSNEGKVQHKIIKF